MEAALVIAAVAVAASFCSSILFLRAGNLRLDSLALTFTEAGLAILAVFVIAGVIRGHTLENRWWTWDAGLTSALVCWLIYAAYLLLRQAIEEPTRRATFAAVFSILAFLDVPIAATCIAWWRNRRNPRPPLWTAAPPSLLWTALALAPLAVLLAVVRFRQHERRRDLDAQLRRTMLEDR
jgi:heme exporter protein C